MVQSTRGGKALARPSRPRNSCQQRTRCNRLPRPSPRVRCSRLCHQGTGSAPRRLRRNIDPVDTRCTRSVRVRLGRCLLHTSDTSMCQGCWRTSQEGNRDTPADWSYLGSDSPCQRGMQCTKTRPICREEGCTSPTGTAEMSDWHSQRPPSHSSRQRGNRCMHSSQAPS